ncbi:MAG: CCA tRNA nucleotidyltransferase [Deltaproteobacteria bacterium]|nr:MAG: CCA tRNA nucleotidyltransferase [Deltaproteobacteria bacterium]
MCYSQGAGVNPPLGFFDMPAAVHMLCETPFLPTLADLLRDGSGPGRFCLVGGAVRDAFLGRVSADFDFAAERDPTALARAFAVRTGGHWFWLDKSRCQSRVVAAGLTFDFAPWRAPTLAGDLAARDFTINAMAVDLAGLAAAALFDPLGGRRDLEAQLLRCCGPGVLADDPLRILKGIRHAVQLGLTVEADTLVAMSAAADSLPLCAPERVRLEIWRILASAEIDRGLLLLAECGAGKVLFGDRFTAVLPGIRAALHRAGAFFAALLAKDESVAGYLHAPVEAGLNRLVLLCWCRLLGSIDPLLPLSLARRWRFGRAALSRIAALVEIPGHFRQELAMLPRRPRAIALWARQFGADPVDLLLMAGLLDESASRVAADRLMPFLDELCKLPDTARIPPLVDGRWLESELGVSGTGIAGLQATLRQLEISGRIASVEEARSYLLENHPKKG